MRPRPFEIKLFDSVREYLRYQRKSGFRDSLLEKTENGYPKLFAMGWCSYLNCEIVILKKGAWQKRLIHEIGHELARLGCPYYHTTDSDHVMYPYFWRGQAGTYDILTDYGHAYGRVQLNYLEGLIGVV